MNKEKLYSEYSKRCGIEYNNIMMNGVEVDEDELRGIYTRIFFRLLKEMAH